ncbi:hypothetical protein Dda_2447 [Drechslerella dactyloides]|uniref:Uncharacterized protein n=1 Tax=Drechslerella dactyloides TaxID=74499 RepID=A0AAD6J114_DREDA|nr:hypothetical protein Dda_2447 [Drechslerella dactyloides]
MKVSAMITLSSVALFSCVSAAAVKLEARGWRGGPICNQVEGSYAEPLVIQTEGIPYLRRHGGNCHAGAGPRTCERVSCSNKAAIFLCNDNNYEINIPCNTVADGAEAILNECSIRPNVNSIKGQFFANENYNVVVRFDGNRSQLFGSHLESFDHNMGSYLVYPFVAVKQSYRKREAEKLKRKSDRARVREWLAFTAQYQHEWVDEDVDTHLLVGKLQLDLVDSPTSDATTVTSPTLSRPSNDEDSNGQDKETDLDTSPLCVEAQKAEEVKVERAMLRDVKRILSGKGSLFGQNSVKILS